jgi:hypothetical protein
MVLVREVIQCKPGKVKEMLGKFKGVSELMVKQGMPGFRFYTDLSGERFWTLIAEIEAESVNAFLEMEAKVMSNEEAGKLMAGYHDLIQNGRREIYRVES